MVFVLIPGATYVVGRAKHANSVSERFRQAVVLDPFLIAKHEMSRGQWERCTGRPAPEGGFLQMVLELGPELPMEGISWEQVDGMLHEFGLVLPTEAQWEYAAAAATETRYWWGDLLPPRGSPPDNLRDVNYAAASSVYEGFFRDPRFRPHPIQRRMVESGRLGRKSVRGYYDYRADASPGATG